MSHAKKAVIAAAGLGTRFLPWTKAMPKEMLPIGNQPVIQQIVSGLVAAGVEQIAIVGGPQKRAIENHFDPSVELEQALDKKGKHEQADELRKITDMAHFVYIGQNGEPQGNALPLLNAVDAGFIDEDQSEPFFFMFADDFFQSEVPHPQQLLDAYELSKKSVISLVEVAPEDASKYGMADVADEISDGVFEIAGLVEKPDVEKRPSDLAAVSGYLLTPAIIPLARSLKPSPRGEIELPEAIGQLAASNEVIGKRIDGVYHDAGNPTSYAIAVIDYALNDPDSQDAVQRFLRERLKQ